MAEIKKAEVWMPKPHITEIFEIVPENIESIKFWLNARSVKPTYQNYSKTVYEFNLDGRELLTVVQGNYLVRQFDGKIVELESQELRSQYEKMD